MSVEVQQEVNVNKSCLVSKAQTQIPTVSVESDATRSKFATLHFALNRYNSVPSLQKLAPLQNDSRTDIQIM